jgi:hypothetical protein
MTGPSWSWLSVASTVEFIATLNVSWNSSAVALAEYVGHNVELANKDPMGRVLAGQIRLFCHVRQAHNRITTHNFGPGIDQERFDNGYDMNWQRDVQGSWYCVLARTLYKHKLGHYKKQEAARMAQGHILGLILEIVQENPRVFRRIGMFSHSWIEKGSEPMPEYPEFADVVDPQYLEREEITII